jgi:ATP-binding cassette, subfamily B (MDR/TAP), member 1
MIPFIGVSYGLIIPIVLKRTKEASDADAKASSIASEALTSIRMIVACGAQDQITKKYSEWISESRKRGLRISLFIGLQYVPPFFAVYSTMALCFWFGFKLYKEGHIDNVGTIVIVLTSVMMLAFSAGQTAAPITAASKAAAAAGEFFTISQYN